MVLPYQNYPRTRKSLDVGSTDHMLAWYSQDIGSEPITPTEIEKPRCRICWEELDAETAPMPCGHRWCRSCVVRACKGVRNESQWPIRCSSHFGTSCYISFDTVKPFLPHSEIQRLAPLIEEFESPKLGRTYCSNRRCGIFVPRGKAQDRIAHCQACQTNTCSDCKGPAHETDNCPLPDHSEQRILMLSHDKDWKRCTQCGQMCEKSDGCSHMTCLCGYHFCYRCAGSYPNCDCEAEYYRRHDVARGRKTTVSGSESVDQRQARLQKDFIKFTTRRARKRTGTEPETLHEQIQRPQGSLQLMLRRMRQQDVGRTAQIRRDQEERARQQQSSSNTGRHLREFLGLRGRLRGP